MEDNEVKKYAKLMIAMSTDFLSKGITTGTYIANLIIVSKKFRMTRIEYDKLSSNGRYPCPDCGSRQTHPAPTSCGCPGHEHINKYHHTCKQITEEKAIEILENRIIILVRDLKEGSKAGSWGEIEKELDALILAKKTLRAKLNYLKPI